MGYESIKGMLGHEFSFRQYTKACLLSESQFKEARNQLKILARRGTITRLARNSYEKLIA